MAESVCAECGLRPAKYYMIHPGSGRPVRVCSSCETALANRIMAKEVMRPLLGVGTGRRLHVAASTGEMSAQEPAEDNRAVTAGGEGLQAE